MEGIHSILVTPFLPSGELDLESLRALVTFTQRSGAQGVVVLGVLGEAQKLDDEERQRVVETAAEATRDAGLNLTVGVSAGGATVAARFAQRAQEQGAAAVMLAPPPFIAAGPGLLQFFQEVAASISIPIILQDYPPTTGVSLPVAFLKEIAERVPAITAIKCEDAPVPTKMSAIRRAVGDRFALLGGLGGLYFLEELMRGASGSMTGFAYPEILCQIYQAHRQGEQQRALELFSAFLPLIRFEAQPGIGLALRKEILHRRGVITSSTLRTPGATLDEATRAELDLWLASVQS